MVNPVNIVDPFLYRTASWVPMVSSIERFHCIQDSQLGPMVSSIERFHSIQDSQLGPDCVLYREVPLCWN